MKILLKYLLLILALIFLFKRPSIAITGKEISEKVKVWLFSEKVIGEPIFSKTNIYKDCNGELKFKRLYKNYKTIKVSCSDYNGFQFLMRVKIADQKKQKKTKSFDEKKIAKKKIFKKSKEKVNKKKISLILRLKKSLEKNAIIVSEDIELVEITNSSQNSFFSSKKEIVGRKLKKNLKMGQLLHPRHLYEKFEISSGDVISIVSNIGNASVTVSGEAQDSGNLGDLIKVKNLRSGKIIKGYIKKNKIIRIFR